MRAGDREMSLGELIRLAQTFGGEAVLGPVAGAADCDVFKRGAGDAVNDGASMIATCRRLLARFAVKLDDALDPDGPGGADVTETEAREALPDLRRLIAYLQQLEGWLAVRAGERKAA
jgi:hypothetical protein